MIKLLIVEDEKPISDLMVMNLTRAGYKCTAVYNGREAADLLEETQNFDLILLDVMLPEINGYELMEFIRPMGIPVIFITDSSYPSNSRPVKRGKQKPSLSKAIIRIVLVFEMV